MVVILLDARSEKFDQVADTSSRTDVNLFDIDCEDSCLFFLLIIYDV